MPRGAGQAAGGRGEAKESSLSNVVRDIVTDHALLQAEHGGAGEEVASKTLYAFLRQLAYHSRSCSAVCAPLHAVQEILSELHARPGHRAQMLSLFNVMDAIEAKCQEDIGADDSRLESITTLEALAAWYLRLATDDSWGASEALLRSLALQRIHKYSVAEEARWAGRRAHGAAATLQPARKGKLTRLLSSRAKSAAGEGARPGTPVEGDEDRGGWWGVWRDTAEAATRLPSAKAVRVLDVLLGWAAAEMQCSGGAAAAPSPRAQLRTPAASPPQPAAAAATRAAPTDATGLAPPQPAEAAAPARGLAVGDTPRQAAEQAPVSVRLVEVERRSPLGCDGSSSDGEEDEGALVLQRRRPLAGGSVPADTQGTAAARASSVGRHSPAGNGAAAGLSSTVIASQRSDISSEGGSEITSCTNYSSATISTLTTRSATPEEEQLARGGKASARSPQEILKEYRSFKQTRSGSAA